MVDYSNAVFTPAAELVGQTANCPIHLGAMHFSAEASIEEFGRENLEEGDVIVLNDPYQGGTHIPDVTLTKPIYDDNDDLLGFGVSRGHWQDLGGGGPGGYSLGNHLAEEGLRIPPRKVVKAGKRNDDLIQLIKRNTRTPQYIEGDMQAQIGAVNVAESEYHRLANKYGPDTVRQGMEEVINYTERRTRAAIEDLPDGEYQAQDYCDCDGISKDSVWIDVTLTVDGDEIDVDFSGSDPAVEGAINSPLSNTLGAVYYSLKFFLDPDAPANAGMYRPLNIDVPEGTWINAEWPRPTIVCTQVSASTIEGAIWKALKEAIPDKMVALNTNDPNFFNIQQEDPETGNNIVWADLPPGGWGGTPYNDGMETTVCPLQNCLDLPPERAELLNPVTIEHREFIPDSAGAGKHRGGLGMRAVYRFHGPAKVSQEITRTKEGPWPTNGGEAGRPGRMLRNYGEEDEEVIAGWQEEGEWVRSINPNIPFDVGESLTVETQGGGGWGNQADRDPEAIQEDIIDGKLRPETAEERYDVQVDENGNVQAAD